MFSAEHQGGVIVYKSVAPDFVAALRAVWTKCEYQGEKPVCVVATSHKQVRRIHAAFKTDFKVYHLLDPRALAAWDSSKKVDVIVCLASAIRNLRQQHYDDLPFFALVAMRRMNNEESARSFVDALRPLRKKLGSLRAFLICSWEAYQDVSSDTLRFLGDYRLDLDFETTAGGEEETCRTPAAAPFPTSQQQQQQQKERLAGRLTSLWNSKETCLEAMKSFRQDAFANLEIKLSHGDTNAARYLEGSPDFFFSVAVARDETGMLTSEISARRRFSEILKWLAAEERPSINVDRRAADFAVQSADVVEEQLEEALRRSKGDLKVWRLRCRVEGFRVEAVYGVVARRIAVLESSFEVPCAEGERALRGTATFEGGWAVADEEEIAKEPWWAPARAFTEACGFPQEFLVVPLEEEEEEEEEGEGEGEANETETTARQLETIPRRLVRRVLQTAVRDAAMHECFEDAASLLGDSALQLLAALWVFAEAPSRKTPSRQEPRPRAWHHETLEKRTQAKLKTLSACSGKRAAVALLSGSNGFAEAWTASGWMEEPPAALRHWLFGFARGSSDELSPAFSEIFVEAGWIHVKYDAFGWCRYTSEKGWPGCHGCVSGSDAGQGRSPAALGAFLEEAEKQLGRGGGDPCDEGARWCKETPVEHDDVSKGARARFLFRVPRAASSPPSHEYVEDRCFVLPEMVVQFLSGVPFQSLICAGPSHGESRSSRLFLREVRDGEELQVIFPREGDAAARECRRYRRGRDENSLGTEWIPSKLLGGCSPCKKGTWAELRYDGALKTYVSAMRQETTRTRALPEAVVLFLQQHCLLQLVPEARPPPPRPPLSVDDGGAVPEDCRVERDGFHARLLDENGYEVAYDAAASAWMKLCRPASSLPRFADVEDAEVGAFVPRDFEKLEDGADIERQARRTLLSERRQACEAWRAHAAAAPWVQPPRHLCEAVPAALDLAALARLLSCDCKTSLWLLEAFTHGSWGGPAVTPSQRCMASLGRSVLRYLVVEFFLEAHGCETRGVSERKLGQTSAAAAPPLASSTLKNLSEQIEAWCCDASLSRACVAAGLHSYVLGSPALKRALALYGSVPADGDVNALRDAPRCLADTFAASLAAVLLNSSWAHAHGILRRLVAEFLLSWPAAPPPVVAVVAVPKHDEVSRAEEQAELGNLDEAQQERLPFCDVCCVTFRSEAQLTEHRAGRRHRGRAAMWRARYEEHVLQRRIPSRNDGVVYLEWTAHAQAYWSEAFPSSWVYASWP